MPREYLSDNYIDMKKYTVQEAKCITDEFIKKEAKTLKLNLAKKNKSDKKVYA